MFVYENLIDGLYSMQTLDFLQIGKKYVIKAVKTDKCQDRKVWIKYSGKDVEVYNVIVDGLITNHLANGFIYTGAEKLGIYTEGISKKDMCSILHDEYNFFIYESGTHSDVYEPYKSNILTVNEDVTLRGIGEVKDELDLMTGEVTERIGESSELLASTMIESQELTNTKLFTIKLPNDMDTSSNQYIICDKLPTIDPNAGGLWNTDVEGIAQFVVGNSIRLRLSKNKCTTLEEFHEWLNQNQITIQYQLATESVKTVDLNILNQNGENVKQLMSFNGGTHFTTSSQEGSLQPTIIVDVVTDLEETLNLCSMDGNTL